MKQPCLAFFCGLLLVAPTVVQAQFTYSTNADNTLTLAGYSGAGGNVSIPCTNNGLTVTAIGTNVFTNAFVTSVTMPNTVTSIDDMAFNHCSKLTNVVMSDTLLNIGNGAFAVCSSLASAAIPASVTNIGNAAFLLCSSLASVSIPADVNSIGISAFEDCTKLSNAGIAYGVTSLGIDAFLECTSLTNLVIPASVTNMGTYAFAFCSSLTSVTIPDSVNNLAAGAFAVCDNLTNVTIPASVTNIGANAFSGTSLTSVTIPSSVTSIAAYAFSGTSLTSLTISSSVTNIGNDAFIVCSDLTNITVSGQNLFYSSTNGLLFDKTQATLIEYPAGLAGNYTIPGSVTSIGNDAFEDSGLTKVFIPSGVTNIGSGAFSGTSLTNVTIPSSVINIGDEAFILCPDLSNITVAGQNSFYSSVNGVLFDISQSMLIEFPASLGATGAYTIPGSVQDIADGAFAGCKLANVTVPASVTNIGDSAFFGCTNLEVVFFEGNAPATDPSAFNSDSHAAAYYLPGTTGWSSPFAGVPALLWNPLMEASGASFGMQSNQFGFTITGTANIVVVVQACTHLAGGVWRPVRTVTLTNGVSYFSDPVQTDNPERFYRLSVP